MIIHLLITYLIYIPHLISQYAENSLLFDQAITDGDKALLESLEKTKDSKPIFYPKTLELPHNQYINDYPPPASYKIEIIIDPCRSLNYSCCTNTFGTAEYPSLIINGLETERVVRYNVLGNESEVQVNYQGVYEDGSVVPDGASRYADDSSIFDPTCVAKNVPYSYCAGRNYAFRRSTLRPPCSDNNSTLDALSGCAYPNGTAGSKCFQVGFNQNAFIASCDPSFTTPVCGTYLEVHSPRGTLYAPEQAVLGEVLLTTFNTSGVSTDVLPTTWRGDPNRVLCAYEEVYFRPGSPVYITASAPVCCCPRQYDAHNKLGAYYCPYGTTGAGPFAVAPQTLSDEIAIDALLDQYPYCLSTPQSTPIDRFVSSLILLSIRYTQHYII